MKRQFRIRKQFFSRRNFGVKIVYLGVMVVLLLLGYEKVEALSTPSMFEGKIIKIYDGDTITLDIGDSKKTRIRLFGIDAPESTQNFGAQSQENLLKLCPLESVAKVKVTSKDKYGRYVGIVFCNEIDANEKQVKDGFAWAYKEYSLRYFLQESEARMDKRGLWSEPNPIYPPDYRKQQKSSKYTHKQ